MNNKGFTLLELVVSMSIMAIILALGIGTLIAARRQQELLTTRDALVDAIREARNTALSTTATSGASGPKVIGIFLDTTGDVVQQVQYTACGPTTTACGLSKKTINKKPDVINNSRIHILGYCFGQFFCDPSLPPQTGQVAIFYSVPFGKACIRGLSQNAADLGLANSVSGDIDADYPIDWGDVGDRRCVDDPDSVQNDPECQSNPACTPAINSNLNVVFGYEGTGIRTTLRINSFSGDVSE